MANNLTVVTACTMVKQGVTATYTVSQVVPPTDPFYYDLLENGYATLTGTPNPAPPTVKMTAAVYQKPVAGMPDRQGLMYDLASDSFLPQTEEMLPDRGANTPATPVASTLKHYAKSVAGRMLTRIIGPNGNLPVAPQPALFQNRIELLLPGSGATITTLGNTAVNTGTISHPAVTEALGDMANLVTAGTAATTASSSSSLASFMRGTTPGLSNGFFYTTRIVFPDGSYDQSGVSTGSRLFSGLSSAAIATMLATDNPAGHHCGFQRMHTDSGRQDVNWQFMTKDNVTQALVDTGIPFVAGHIYEIYMFCGPAATSINWRIDDVNAGTTSEGSTASNLPGATTTLRFGTGLYSVDAVARNVRFQHMYCESDR